MKLIRRIGGAMVALIVILFALQIAASEAGEVVEITTIDAAGAPHETRVWIVDSNGRAWIRSGSETSGWYTRLKQTPTLDVERDGRRTTFSAVADPAAIDSINALMREKYGWADAYIGAFFPRKHAIALRLEPLAADPA